MPIYIVEPSPIIIGGVQKSTSSNIPIINPYTDEILGYVCRASPKEVEEAITSAEKGADEMAHLPSHVRSSILHRLADLMEESSREFTDLIIREGAKVYKNAAVEVSRAIHTIRISAEEAVRIKGEMIPMDSELSGDKRWAILTRVPVGIVLAITPFNFPLNLVCHKVGPAIAAGNSFILKPSSQTPLTALKFGELLVEAGVPRDAVNVISCDTREAELMVKDRRIGGLTFTGSPKVGWYLRSITKAGKVALELGGNAAVIVHNDSDIIFAAKRIVDGAFTHAGQVCISVQRVFAERSIYQQLLDEIIKLAEKLVLGDPLDPDTDLGPMIRQDKAIKALQLISDAEKEGARVIYGGKKSGKILVPTILVNTNAEMKINKEEAFAPVLTVTPYDTFQNAIDMVNDSRFGLQAGVFTQNLSLAFSASQNIRCGAVIINDIPMFRVDSMPYGGVKESGIGKEGPLYAIREMTEERLLVFTP